MKIVIDGRLYSQSGVGRYLQKLIQNLALVDKKNRYLVFLTKKDYFAFNPPAKNFEKKLVDVPWHSLAEQLFLPVYLIKEHPDLVHFPYFSVPILYPGKFIVTIHDLTIDHFDTGKASTHNQLIYQLKRFFYKLVVFSAIKRTKAIIAVSKATKKEIIEHYHINPRKIAVIYEAAEFLPNKKFPKPLIASPYLLYVGNAYPHKNLEKLIEAFNLLKSQFNQLKLVLVGKKDYFYQRLEKNLTPLKKKNIIFFGFANDEQLVNLYSHAEVFVFPSLMEGFGLPGLEAMSMGLPVVCSDIPVFREIYQDAAYYFNPNDSGDIAERISKLLKDKLLQKKLKTRGLALIKKFSWIKMAKETLKTYVSTQRHSRCVFILTH